ncbi:aldo/keto reductase [Thalassospira sp. MA62]|nr:aldo/keto reductase [Thalassospira sp. MA62]
MQKRTLGRTGLEISPIVFGGNIFGWTVDEKQSFAILDQLVDIGLTTIDTADVYSAWADGNSGGESETVIGNWLKANPDKRDKVQIFTKVGSEMGPGKKGLGRKWIMEAVEDSLRRLQTEQIDLYMSHWPDPDTPYGETLRAYEDLLKAGKIRNVGCSNLNASQLAESLQVARDNNLPRYDVLQPEYNLYDRDGFDADLRRLVQDEDIGVITYFSLASGFLSGKYRSKDDLQKSARGKMMVEKYLTPRGEEVLNALDTVSTRHNAKPAEVALAWLLAQKAVTAPIASATSSSQIESLVKATELQLTPDDLAVLNPAGQ